MGYFPHASAAVQHWVYNSSTAVLIRDNARYLRIDPAERVARMKAWNKPVWWPLGLLLALGVSLWWVARRQLRQRERTNARGQVLAG
jgi:hypothetical protein